MPQPQPWDYRLDIDELCSAVESEWGGCNPCGTPLKDAETGRQIQAHIIRILANHKDR